MLSLSSSLLASLVVAYAIVVTAWFGEALKFNECSENDYLRLPKRVQPEHYNIEVFVDPNAPAFTGEVSIHVRHHDNWDDGLCDKLAARGQPKSLACDRSAIILGAYHTMQFTGIEYEETDSATLIPVQYVCRMSKQDLIVIGLTREPAPGSTGQLRIGYQSEIGDENGLFRVESRDKTSGIFKNITVTEFQPASARRACPCFDEPDFKATFELAVFHPSNLIAISNTPVASREEQALVWPGKEFTKTQFGRTPKMSTYLLTFALGEFDYIESKVDDKMTIGMYTPPGRSEEARGQLTTAVQAYKLLRDFFDVEQPISKLDFVAVRAYDAAMENWGMITHDESLLLPNRDQLDPYLLNRARRTLIHEISHQWFGNLVTMKWWDDLWLNEGFAEWISADIYKQLYPHADAKSVWMLENRRYAFDYDALPSLTHAIKNSSLQTADEIKATFDAITYDKAHCMIRMLEIYLGRDKFQEGLRAYIKKHAYGNTEDTDLWEILAETSGVDVGDLMRNWLHKPGFPLITVKARRGKLMLSQKRLGAPETKQKWVVPISMWLADGKGRLEQMKFTLSTQSSKVQLPDWFNIKKPGHWLKLNAGAEGFYFTSYDRKLYAALQRPIETKAMSPVDRYSILEESLGKLRRNVIKHDEFMTLVGWFKDEDDDLVVSLICSSIYAIQVNYEQYPHLFPSLVNHLDRHGLENDTSDEPNLMKLFARGSVLYTLVASNYKPAIQRSLEQFIKTNGKVPGFFQDGIYLAVGIEGTDEQFKQVAEVLAKMDPGPNKKNIKKQLLKVGQVLTDERKQVIAAC